MILFIRELTLSVNLKKSVVLIFTTELCRYGWLEV